MDPTKKYHYLLLTWSEDPENPTFNRELDWEITHPPDCAGHFEEVKITGHTWRFWNFDCEMQWEIDGAGVEIFGSAWDRQEGYSNVPAAFPIEQWVEKYRGEVDTGVRLVNIDD